MKKIAILLLGVFGFINSCYATLTDEGGVFVNDSSLNITWMKDANVFKTLCDANNPIATGFVPVDTVDATTICANNGKMTWNDAQAWIARLNVQIYLGYNDWRQPTTTQLDATCESQGDSPSQGYGFNCRGSELGHLFNSSLGNPNDGGTGATGGSIGNNCYGSAPHCFQTTTPFNNAQSLCLR